MKHFCKTQGGLAALGTLALFGAAAAAHAAVSPPPISYFNFNTLTSGAVDVTTLAPTTGTGSLVTNFNGTAPITVTAGTTFNAVGGDPAGNALSLDSSGTDKTSNNGNYLEYRFSSASYKGLTLSFAMDADTHGFTTDDISYSVNGGASYTAFSTGTAIPAAFATQTVNLTGVTALNNLTDARLRITFNGGNGQGGVARLDNLKVSAQTPGPSSALVALLGVVPGVIALRRRRK